MRLLMALVWGSIFLLRWATMEKVVTDPIKIEIAAKELAVLRWVDIFKEDWTESLTKNGNQSNSHFSRWDLLNFLFWGNITKLIRQFWHLGIGEQVQACFTIYNAWYYPLRTPPPFSATKKRLRMKEEREEGLLLKEQIIESRRGRVGLVGGVWTEGHNACYKSLSWSLKLVLLLEKLLPNDE